MGRQIEELARFVAETRCEDIPEPVRAHAKLVLLDTLGVILAGGERPEVAALRERLGATAGTGATVYARGWPGHDPRTAALLNGIAGRAIELCEGLRLVSGQAAMQVLPAVLAVGEQAQSQRARDAGGVHSRIRCRRAARRRVHAAPAGASERAGVAARCGGGRGKAARARRHRDQPRDAHRHNVAADPELYECGGRRDGAERGRRDERLRRRARPGTGAGRVRGAAGRDRGGARAAGRRRFHRRTECSTSLASGGRSRATTSACTPAATRSTRRSIASRRRSPSCARPGQIDPEQIERIEVATYRFASVMRNPDPPNYFASKYSLPHAAAAMVVRGGAGFAELDDSALRGPGDRGVAPPGPDQRRPGDERACAAICDRPGSRSR